MLVTDSMHMPRIRTKMRRTVFGEEPFRVQNSFLRDRLICTSDRDSQDEQVLVDRLSLYQLERYWIQQQSMQLIRPGAGVPAFFFLLLTGLFELMLLILRCYVGTLHTIYMAGPSHTEGTQSLCLSADCIEHTHSSGDGAAGDASVSLTTRDAGK